MGNWEKEKYVPQEYDYFEQAYQDMLIIKKEEEMKQRQVVYVEK